jgi:hypothetical protein
MDIVFILGDLNAKLGTEWVCSNITGKYTVHEETYGEISCEFAFAYNMIIMNTYSVPT